MDPKKLSLHKNYPKAAVTQHLEPAQHQQISFGESLYEITPVEHLFAAREPPHNLLFLVQGSISYTTTAATYPRAPRLALHCPKAPAQPGGQSPGNTFSRGY